MEPSQQPWPSELNSARQGHGLELKDKYTVRYGNEARHYNDVGAIQANHPVPSNCNIYYFELTVLDQGVDGKIAIGFADKSFKLSRQPGWEVGSYGYHGDDGKKFVGSGVGEDYGPTFGTGDTVGAGIHMSRQELFFTKNGTKLKVACRPVRAGLYPTIGLHSKGEMVQVNFGQKPFVFDLEGLLAEEKAAQRAAVDRIPVTPGVTHKLVRQYMLHYGYEETLRAFDEAAGLAGQEEPGQGQQQAAAGPDRAAAAAAAAAAPSSSTAAHPPSSADATAAVVYANVDAAGSLLPLRARLRCCVLAGDVDGALALLAEHCPAVLSNSVRFGEVHFHLACQKYIELIRCGRVEEAVLFAQGTLSQLRGRSSAFLEPSLRDVVALVAYAQPDTSPLAHLLGRQQRGAVADALNAAVLQVAAAPAAPCGPSDPAAAASGGDGGGSATAAALQLRPALAPVRASEPPPVPPQQPAAAQRLAVISGLEALLRQLLAVQGALREANGGQGGGFDIREYLPGGSQPT